MLNFYDLLQISETASAEEVKRAYFDYLRRIHPDKGADKKASSESVTLATQIWSILKDPVKRREYNHWLREQEYRKNKGTVVERIELAGDDGDPIEEPCRCGDRYSISAEEIQKIVDIGVFECCSCSLCLEVVKSSPPSAELLS